MRGEASVVGMPIPGLPGLDAVTSERDWVVTGSNYGKPFRRYVSPHVTKDEALAAVALAMGLTVDGLEWIKAERRNEVERCIRVQGDWLRSRTL